MTAGRPPTNTREFGYCVEAELRRLDLVSRAVRVKKIILRLQLAWRGDPTSLRTRAKLQRALNVLAVLKLRIAELKQPRMAARYRQPRATIPNLYDTRRVGRCR